MNKDASKKTLWDSKLLWVVISLIASVLLWVYVTTTEGSQRRQTYTGVPVVFNGAETIRDRDGLVITDVSAGTVNVTLSGSLRDLSRLSKDNLTAVVDVSKISSPSSHTSNLTISFPSTVNPSSITVVSTNPGSVSFVVDRSDQKTIAVKGEFTGTVVEGFNAGKLSFDPDTIIIRGPSNELEQVDHAWISVNQQDVDRTLSFSTTFVLRDASGKELDLGNISLDTDTVNVTLPILISKVVPLSVDLVEGAGATGSNVSVKCAPESISISGDAEILEGINRISLGTVNLATFASTFEESFPIVLPDGVNNVTGITEAKVTIQIEGLETRTLDVTNITIPPLNEGYTGTVLTDSLEVRIRGAADIIDEIQASNIRVVADISEVGSAVGEFTVPVRIYIDGYTDVGPIGDKPYTIVIRIS